MGDRSIDIQLLMASYAGDIEAQRKTISFKMLIVPQLKNTDDFDLNG